jgi:hypothetical protein
MRKTRRVAANLSWRLVTTNQSAQSEEEVSMSNILADEIFQKLYLNHSWVQLGIYGIANFLTSLPNPSSAPVWELRHEPAHGAASDFRVRNMALSENRSQNPRFIIMFLLKMPWFIFCRVYMITCTIWIIYDWLLYNPVLERKRHAGTNMKIGLVQFSTGNEAQLYWESPSKLQLVISHEFPEKKM